MSLITASERCSCGASIEVSNSYHPQVASTLSAWRTEHRHDRVEIHAGPLPPIPQGTASTIERAEQFDHDTRQPIGFGSHH